MISLFFNLVLKHHERSSCSSFQFYNVDISARIWKTQKRISVFGSRFWIILWTVFYYFHYDFYYGSLNALLVSLCLSHKKWFVLLPVNCNIYHNSVNSFDRIQYEVVSSRLFFWVDVFDIIFKLNYGLLLGIFWTRMTNNPQQNLR